LPRGASLPPLRSFLTRVGYASLGAVYGALGFLAVRVAVEGSRNRVRGFRGSFRFLLDQPWGRGVLAGIAAGLAAFTLARLLDAVDRKRSFFPRLFSLIDALGHAVLAWAAVALILRLRRGPNTRTLLGWVLSHPWGAPLLETVGGVVIVAGTVQIAQAISGRLPQRLGRRKLGAAAPAAFRVGRFGYATRGVVSVIVGWFLVRAAKDLDPASYHDVGAALGVIEAMRFGGFLLAGAGAGLVAYGLYLFLLGLFRPKS
jgi:hypothetical protein